MSVLKIIQTDGSEFGFGTIVVPRRKRPGLCIVQGTELTVLATFRSNKAAEAFEHTLDRLMAMFKTGTITVLEDGDKWPPKLKHNEGEIGGGDTQPDSSRQTLQPDEG